MTDYMKEAERLIDNVATTAFANALGEIPSTKHKEARTALLAHIQRGVPEGWQLVPKEPTDAMRAAVIREQRALMHASNGLQGDGPACDQYRAMLAAAPAPDQFRDDTTESEKVSEQSAFEDWLEKKSPSGDSESVQRQWERSSEFEDWLLDQEREAPAPDHFRDDAGMVAEPADDRIAAAIHYPECWDTAAYPTVESALSEVFVHYHCTEHDAPAEVPMPEPVPEPVAYLYTLEYGSTVVNTRLSVHQLNYPFGVCGSDYLARSDEGVSYVRQVPLYSAACRAAGEAAGYARGLAEAGRYRHLRTLVISDSYAATFQSLAQYRSALLKYLNEPTLEMTHAALRGEVK